MSLLKVDYLEPKSNNTTVTVNGDLYCENLSVADFIMSNDRENTRGNDIDGTKGHWVFQEGLNDLFIINKKTGKSYKIVLQEV